MSEAETRWVFPISALGLNISQGIMQPINHRVWVVKDAQELKTIELRACLEEPGIRYECNKNTLWLQGISLEITKGKCHYAIIHFANESV